MTLALSGIDAAILLFLPVLLGTGWLLMIIGLTLARWVVYAGIAAAAVQVVFHTGTLTEASPPTALVGFLLVASGLFLRWLTIRQLSRLEAAGRFTEVSWRLVAAFSLWVAGAGCVLTVVHPWIGLATIVAAGIWVCLAVRPDSRRIRTHNSVEIRCTPAAAFALVGDPRKFSRYVEGYEVDAPANQEVGIGYRYRSRFRGLSGYVFEVDEEILDYQPGRLIRETVVGVPSVGTCTVERAPAGTRVIYDYEGRLSFPQALLDLRTRTVVDITGHRQRTFQRLKAILEGPPGKADTLQAASYGQRGFSQASRLVSATLGRHHLCRPRGSEPCRPDAPAPAKGGRR